MPAAYAHLTLVNVLKERRRLETIAGMPRPAVIAVGKYAKFCELGAVSPDYPYLALGDADAAKWADAMHYTCVGDMIRAGADYVRSLSGEVQQKCVAWLLGYCAHVAMDVTVHPVIELKVGPYADNKLDHRVCEMHQDVYIFKKHMNLDVGLAEFLDSGIRACGRDGDPDRLDEVIARLWTAMMQTAHADEFARNPPDVDLWHRRFGAVVDDIAEEGGRLLPIARHVAGDVGLTYPLEHELDHGHLDGLQCPRGGARHYDQIFDLALKNVGNVWNWVANAALRGVGQELAQITAWNLDTGRDEHGQLVFWA